VSLSAASAGGIAAIRLEPLRETAHRTLVEIHLAEGNLSEACRQFERYQRLLREELGVEPSDSMRLLTEKRRGSPHPLPSQWAQLGSNQ
jgi:DNA-binding SARP family transcriptional activator